MSGKYYIIDNRNKKFNGAVKETAAIIYLRSWNEYNAAKKGQEDKKRAIISMGIIIAFLFFFTIIAMVSNNT